MFHLDVLGKSACGAEGELRKYTDFVVIECPECLASVFGKAAERMNNAESWYAAQKLAEQLQRIPRITGPLGDSTKVDPDAPVRERLRQRDATMSDDEKLESFRRIQDIAIDTCPGCGGSIRENDHASDCVGPDPENWVLTDEDVDAELRVQGIDPEKSKERFLKLIGDLERGRRS